jgi:hypothetical protein
MITDTLDKAIKVMQKDRDMLDVLMAKVDKLEEQKAFLVHELEVHEKAHMNNNHVGYAHIARAAINMVKG